ncbi:hypothetical protein GUJ93_ZPchr0013g35162 [Zizania palustris]|uniref:DUF7804 domain-containing protein n=1 Tax=Zizania palustris TaxID=103762 RepID=A0A8J5WYX3_ZIZPA|nr:hypothetical protein GUJ93_ZPchr0013g35162 [Zizania palustris]
MAAAAASVRGYSPAPASTSSAAALYRGRRGCGCQLRSPARSGGLRCGSARRRRRRAGPEGCSSGGRRRRGCGYLEACLVGRARRWRRRRLGTRGWRGGCGSRSRRSCGTLGRRRSGAPVQRRRPGRRARDDAAESASAESWPGVRQRWGAGGQRRPDGIILVEQIAAAVEDGASAGAAEAARQVWGLVVQARGMDCASCYVLDTCRVHSSGGLCTHFCLARAQCYGEPLELQLRNAWLNRLSGRY